MKSLYILVSLIAINSVFSLKPLRNSVDDGLVSSIALQGSSEDWKKTFALSMKSLLKAYSSSLKLKGEDYAVIENLDQNTVTFEACPSTVFGRILGCNSFETQAGKPSFIKKKHGVITNDEIQVRVNGKDISSTKEGLWYSWDGSKLTHNGTIAEWREHHQKP